MSTAHPEIFFDEFSKIRIINPDKFDASEKLKDQCQDFIKRIKTLTRNQRV
jgi:DNA-directed RNA polymerase subunit L